MFSKFLCTESRLSKVSAKNWKAQLIVMLLGCPLLVIGWLLKININFFSDYNNNVGLCAENSERQKSIKKNKNIFGPVAEQKQLCRTKQPKATKQWNKPLHQPWEMLVSCFI